MGCVAAAQTAPPSTLSTGDYPGTLTWGGIARSYTVHVPPAYNCRDALPVVILMHGAGGSSTQAINNYRMNPAADRNGFLVVYPNGTGVSLLGAGLYTWNAVYCCPPANTNGVDDMGFLSALLDQLPKDYKVDTNRIYATGISNGGMMAYRLGAEVSDRIAAIGVVSGSIGGTSSGGVSFQIPQPGRPMPVMIFHGKQDNVIAYNGGPTPSSIDSGRVDKSVADATDFWSAANGCASHTAETLPGGNITRDSWEQCSGTSQVILYSINDGTHSWPGARQPNVLQDLPNQEISADELMWSFFAAHPLKPVPVPLPPVSLPYISDGGITNAASYDQGTVSPGEILTIFGGGLKDAKIWFDQTPAPVFYSSDNQANVVAPFDVTGKNCVSVQAETDQKSAAVVMPVAVAGPGVFTQDTSGNGPGAILNQDNTVNSADNPAEKGSIISIYGTGGGLTSPALADGSTVTLPLAELTQPVKVYIDGYLTDVPYAGPAPGLIAGGMQINAKIPADAKSGTLRVLVGVGPMLSHFDVTVAVK